MTTIQDVAKHAGVGAATVSRVLSGNGYVKQATRERVMRSIEKLNYTPNEMARNLFHGKSGIVAVIIPELSHPFFSEMVSAIEVGLCNLGYQTMVCNTFYEKNYELRYLEMLKRQRVDGIIFGAHTSLAAEMYRELQRPVIGLDRRLAETIPLVAADHVDGGRIAAEELIRSGCRKVAQFGEVEDTCFSLKISRIISSSPLWVLPAIITLYPSCPKSIVSFDGLISNFKFFITDVLSCGAPIARSFCLSVSLCVIIFVYFAKTLVKKNLINLYNLNVESDILPFIQ